jgi:malonyl-CoA/methylmalonyl-CoA synthetase
VDANLYTLFQQHVADAAAPCVVVPNGPVVTYGELDRLSAQIAHALVAPAASPATASPCRPTSTGRCCRCTWPSLRAGLAYLPLNTGYQRAELDYFFATRSARDRLRQASAWASSPRPRAARPC